jgi:hypothetical protein
MIERMSSSQFQTRTYRVIAEGDNDVAGGLPITDALAVAEFAREHGKRHVAIVDEETSAIVDEADARRRFIAPR